MVVMVVLGPRHFLPLPRIQVLLISLGASAAVPTCNSVCLFHYSPHPRARASGCVHPRALGCRPRVESVLLTCSSPHGGAVPLASSLVHLHVHSTRCMLHACAQATA